MNDLNKETLWENFEAALAQNDEDIAMFVMRKTLAEGYDDLAREMYETYHRKTKDYPDED